MAERVQQQATSVPIHRAGWPMLFCPRGGPAGVHLWELTAGSLFCVECGGEVAVGDQEAIMIWWRRVQALVQAPSVLWN